ncbi:hypothetical protein BaRGS_00015977 [Batillaria attramentaria]|uniref:Uncharacterized protein n=1 Tax=Batillaria attramentaria TaxID=370345 RepID=A0ABD0L024_9CAEN
MEFGWHSNFNSSEAANVPDVQVVVIQKDEAYAHHNTVKPVCSVLTESTKIVANLDRWSLYTGASSFTKQTAHLRNGLIRQGIALYWVATLAGLTVYYE